MAEENKVLVAEGNEKPELKNLSQTVKKTTESAGNAPKTYNKVSPFQFSPFQFLRIDPRGLIPPQLEDENGKRIANWFKKYLEGVSTRISLMYLKCDFDCKFDNKILFFLILESSGWFGLG